MKKLRDYLTYSWWKFALLIVAAWFGWSLYFQMSTPPIPEEQKVILGVYAYGNSEKANEYLEGVRQEHMPDMLQISTIYIMPDPTEAGMVLTAHTAAQDCDLYLLPKAQFETLASQNGFKALDETAGGLIATLEEDGYDLGSGWRMVSGKITKHLYGIPCAGLPGLSQIMYGDLSEYYLCVFHTTGNDENVFKFLDLFVQDMRIDPNADQAQTDDASAQATPAPTEAPAAVTPAPQADNQITLCLLTHGSTHDANEWLETFRQAYMPQTEAITAMYVAPDEGYLDMILTNHFLMGDCDLFLLPRTQYDNFALQRSFQPLEEILPDLTAELKAAGAPINSARRTTSDGSTRLYGIPASVLPGLKTLTDTDMSEYYLCVFINTGNDANVWHFTDLFVRTMLDSRAVIVPAEAVGPAMPAADSE